MKTTVRFSLTVLIVLLACDASRVFSAEDFRTFTNRDGKKIVAKIVKIDGDRVTIEQRNGNSFIIEIGTLSEFDQDYIREIDDLGSDSRPAASQPRPNEPAGGAEPLFEFSEGEINWKEKVTEHFRIRYRKNSDPASSHAEKTWDVCAKIMPKLRDDFESQAFRAPGKGINSNDFPPPDDHFRFRIYVVEHPYTFTEMTKAHGARPGIGDKEREKVIKLDEEVGLIEDYENRFLVQRVEDLQGKEIQMVHSLAGGLLQAHVQNGGLPLWMSAGMGYYVENELFDRCRIFYVDFESFYSAGGGAALGDLKKSEILDGITPWSRPVKKMTRSGKTSSLAEVINAQVTTLTPQLSGFIFSLTAFMVSETNLEKFHRYLEALRVQKRQPSQSLLLEIYGYRSAADFEADWYEFINSAQFR